MASAGSLSIGARASRVLQQEPTNPQRSTTSSGESKIRQFTEHECAYMWRRMGLLALRLLNYVQFRNFLITKMPLAIRTPDSSADEFEMVDAKASSSRRKPSQPWKVLTFQDQKLMLQFTVHGCLQRLFLKGNASIIR